MSAEPIDVLAFLDEMGGRWGASRDFATTRAAVAELIEATKALRSFEYRRGDLIHQTSLGAKCKCVKCIEYRADSAIALVQGGA